MRWPEQARGNTEIFLFLHTSVCNGESAAEVSSDSICWLQIGYSGVLSYGLIVFSVIVANTHLEARN